MKVTISDVAKLAGVSTATVSHTINSTRYVSSETKEKVYQAIAELGYTPDASARSFRTGKKKTVGFIVPDIANKFFATMIESEENCLSAHGYHLIIANTKEDMAREETNIRLLSAGLVDGLLIASTMDDFQRLDGLIPAGFPVVLVDRTFDVKKYSSVCVSNFRPIYRSVCRLAGKGARRIGIIGGLPRLSTTRERISAYQQAVADCGLRRMIRSSATATPWRTAPIPVWTSCWPKTVTPSLSARALWARRPSCIFIKTGFGWRRTLTL